MSNTPLKEMPILGGDRSFPMAFFQPHDQQAIRNHGQSLQRLAERGGLSWWEAVCIIENKSYSDFPPKMVNAKEQLLHLYDKFLNRL